MAENTDPADVAAAELAAHPEFAEVPVIEADETVPPRPEEEIADVVRSAPAPRDAHKFRGAHDDSVR